MISSLVSLKFHWLLISLSCKIVEILLSLKYKKVCKYRKNAFVRNKEVIHGFTASVLKSIHGLVPVSPLIKKENWFGSIENWKITRIGARGRRAKVLWSFNAIEPIFQKKNYTWSGKKNSVCDSKRWRVKVILWLTVANVFRVNISKIERTLSNADQREVHGS